MSPGRSPTLALAAGVVHAAALLLVALELGYPVGPSSYSLAGAGWRYAGLVVVAALPVWLALRFRLVAPLAGLALTTGYVLWKELTPPGPTFRDVAALEGLARPTGVTVVEDGLYVVHYMVDAPVWVVGFLLLGVVEFAVRSEWGRLPPLREPPDWLSLPASRRRAAIAAGAGGLLHAAVMTWFAVRLGVTLSGGFEWLLYLFGAVGAWTLAAIPLYLLVRRRLVAPTALLSIFVLFDAFGEFGAGVEDPHALYFGGWFLFLGVALLAGGVEYALRRIDAVRRVASAP